MHRHDTLQIGIQKDRQVEKIFLKQILLKVLLNVALKYRKYIFLGPQRANIQTINMGGFILLNNIY